MLAPPDDQNHSCDWQEYARHLEEKLRATQDELETLQRQTFGKKSEKLPPMDREVRRGEPSNPIETRRKRRERAELKQGLPTERVPVAVPEAERTCPKCGDDILREVGAGKESAIWEYVPARFVRRVYQRQTLVCRCGQYVVTAPSPERVVDKSRYGAGFCAHLVVSKCGDSVPIYRLEKHYRRLGIPIARSTMTDLFHRSAELLAPLSARLLEIVAASDVVLADETSIKMQGTDKRAYFWAFLTDDLIAYRFSPDRSGRTPLEVLGGTQGTLVVDMYTGYNRVTDVDGRTRAGCLAHCRRKFFDALEQAPEASEVLEIIRDVYLIEHEAKQQGVTQGEQHLELRQIRSRPLMTKLHQWLVEREGLHPPKSLMGRAIRYATKNWTELTCFLDDATIPPDNNRSEAALRVVALGRKNYLFVGNEDAGDNIAGLYSLVATCEANGVNPYSYLTDVLRRVSSHPMKRLDELLPHRWAPTDA